MATGRLKNWIQDRGFGFVQPDDGSDDMFVHVSALFGSGLDPDELKKGDRLAYDIAQGRNGKPAAANVRRVA